MTETTLPSGQYILVDVPEDAKKITIRNGTYAKKVLADGVLIDYINESGRLTVIGKADSVSEEQAQNIATYNSKFRYYKNYDNKFKGMSPWIYNTALESFNSWVHSLGKELNKTVIVKKV